MDSVMIESIIERSAKNSFLVILTVIMLLGASIWAIRNTPLDALPDLSPPQVIVQVKWSGQSPAIVEEQVSFPLVTAFMSIPDIETVRAMSSFETGLIYIIFKNGTDLYWSRSRVLEQLSQIQNTLPEGVRVSLGPDATGIGWVYQYALSSESRSLDELRTLQDYYYRYALLGVDGVSEVAAIGGFVKDYEITLDHDKLIQYDLAVDEVIAAVKKANNDTGGRIILENGFEQIVQGEGYLRSETDISDVVIKTMNGFPVHISDVAEVNLVPANRRGMADLNGEGETVGGIVVVRYGENAFAAIERIKARMETLKLKDVEVTTVYDRSDLIQKAINTLKTTLIEESLIVLAITALFLLHLRSALVIIITLPLTVAMTFLLMKLFNIESTIMSLGGIAIAIGAMVDAAIVMVENAHKHLQNHDDKIQNRTVAVLQAAKQVGKPIFFALMIITVSFLPIFALDGQEGKLFSPLAYTKTFAMIVGAGLSITLVPVLMLWLIRGNIPHEHKNPLNRVMIWIYRPLLQGALYLRYPLIAASLGGIVYMGWLYQQQRWEFMPPLNEQTFMYMPVTPYGIGIDQVKELTIKTDKIIASFPEVHSVFGKAGRAETATDPAPLSMIETFIQFRPAEEWREGVTYESLMEEMEEYLQVPGLTNSWTYPIRGRIDMLLTGIRTPLGIKLYGDDLKTIEKSAKEIEQVLAQFDGTMSVFAERSNAGYYLNIKLDESAMARYGVRKERILRTISSGVGGVPVSELIQGIERYPISLRFDETVRNDIHAIGDIHIKTATGFQPLSRFATLSYEEGPSVLKSEKGLKVAFIYITPREEVTSDAYKEEAIELLKKVELPEGYFIEWAGESEYLESAKTKLSYIIPATLLLILILIYFALGNLTNTMLVFFTLPFAVLGGLMFIDLLYFNLSIAVVVGFLALLGIAAETAIVMIIYLEEALSKRIESGPLTKTRLKEAVMEGAVLRVRPKLMTVFAILAGLLPIMYITGVGSEVMQRIAAPMLGGMVSSAVLTLLIVPVLYYMIHASRIK